jgi:hypothetical protein
MTPSLTDLIAGLAIVVSSAAAFVTWKIHQDSGGRVKVRMNAAAYRPGDGSLVHDSSGRMHVPETTEPQIELAQILVENPGRTGVTVTGVHLRVENTSEPERARTPQGFRISGLGAESVDPETYFRLEPYDRRTLYFDYWSVVDDFFGDGTEFEGNEHIR